jgi:hypothetical protein
MTIAGVGCFYRGFMKSHFEGFSPILSAAILVKSATLQAGCVNCRNLGHVGITARATFNSSATGNVVASLYYSPDGKNYDTAAFETVTLTCVQGSAVQVTKLISVPDTGFVKIQVANADATYDAAGLMVWSAVGYQFIEDRQTKADS